MILSEIIILAAVLAIDAMLVSFSYGLVISEKRNKNAFIMASSFAFFQFIMPLIGWVFTNSVYIYLKAYSKWIVFSVFMFLGLKFLFETFKKEEKPEIICISLICLISLAVATSIDALGAGVTIRLCDSNILLLAFLTCAITFCLSLTGFYISSLMKNINSKILGIIAFLLFVYLAVKVL
jgi:putative Mn2+ efflux pump MntP